MEKIILFLCSCVSCFIIIKIIMQYMDGRYKRTVKSNILYINIELVITLGIAFVNLLDIAFLNFAIWVVAVGICSVFLYFEEVERPVKRLLESEVVLFVMAICESLGVGLIDWIMEMLDIEIIDAVMRNCLEVAFSKIILIFLYYMVVERLLKHTPFTNMQYIFNCIILMYSLIDIIVIVGIADKKDNNYLLILNLGCIVLADLYLLYFVKVMNEKNYLEYEVRALEKQANMQYEYYLHQEQKYKRTVQILHDVNKHIDSIEKLYRSGNVADAVRYTNKIDGMLQPLIPVRYTGNPILDILLTDKSTIMSEKGIDFNIKVDNVMLDFIEPIDVTTIFGNLLDNSIEACGQVDGMRVVDISIHSFHEMISIQIKNSYQTIKWKKGIPVSNKGKNRGIGLLNVRACIEKYNGDIKFKEETGMFVIDIFLCK